MGENKVSIIIPVYNAERYLKETLLSVIKQKFQNFEIVAVNDGSRDGTYKILSEFSRQDKRIKIINKDNTGVSDTRNQGIQNASGEYVCFLDADDYLSPNYLEHMLHVAEQNNADMVVCNYISFRGIPVFQDRIVEAEPVYNSDTLVQAGILTSAWTKLIKTSTLSNNDIWFDKNMTFGEDLFFCWKAFIASENVWMINEKLYGYRMTENSATNHFHPGLYEQYKMAFSDLKKFNQNVNYSKDEEQIMDMFFVKRVPSFMLMEAMERKSKKEKYKHIEKILSDDVFQRLLGYKWQEFSNNLKQSEISLYKNAKKKKIKKLLCYGYKLKYRKKLSALKSKLRNYSK
ncbi:MAG: glycosyltransferase family 2 protein [Lachnospiraceae bacterium]|nr:glycosyltransferase family 2 protein [Lachnospiraceae bacterium]